MLPGNIGACQSLLCASSLTVGTCAPQYILELFLEKQRERGEPPSDSPAMVALGEDRGRYSETPAELKRAPVAPCLEIC